MSDNLNIYQKIAILQDRMSISKSKRNEFANFNYRSIDDIYFSLKPLLKELGLVINFCNGTLNEEKYSLGIVVIDINEPNNRISERGEIYIDREKGKMDLSQKVLSAKTFLKKSLLEDLLLINEDADPDSHNNNNRQSSKQNSKQSSKQTNTSKVVTDGQLKRYFAIVNSKNIDINKMDNLIKLMFNIKSKKDWLMKDYSKFIEYVETKQNNEIWTMICNKLTKSNVPIPSYANIEIDKK